MSRLAVVTGGFGFIGSYVCEALSADGWHFAVIDCLRPEAINAGFVRDLPGYRDLPPADVADPLIWGRLRTVFQEIERVQVDAVFHLAAETHVDRSLGLDPTTLAPLEADPVERLYRTNVIGTARAAEFARKVGARLVHWSTDEVYGDATRDDPLVIPYLKDGGSASAVYRFKEDERLVPSSPYAASKVAAEAVVHSWIRLGLRATILRPSNAYGPRQARDKLVPMAIGKLSRGEPVPLYDGGYQVRQWVHAEDIARAALKAIDLQYEGIVNLGGPSLLRNADLVNVLAHGGAACRGQAWVRRAIIDGTPLTVSVPDRPGHDIAYAVSSRRAERDLGWVPARSIEKDAAELFAAYATPPG